MSKKFTVDPVLLQAHASDVRAMANGVMQAGDAADQVGIGGVGTYGVLCSPILIPAIHGFFGDAVDLVQKVGELADTYAMGLESNSRVYKAADADAKDALAKLKSDTF